MSQVYIETSAVLAWLLGEPQAKEVISLVNEAESVATSVLTFIETKRSLIRLETAKAIQPAQRQRVIGLLEQSASSWSLIEMTQEIQKRASEPFPVEPVRSLDALHLASALQLIRIFPDLKILSFDQRILSNLEPLGLSSF